MKRLLILLLFVTMMQMTLAQKLQQANPNKGRQKAEQVTRQEKEEISSPQPQKQKEKQKQNTTIEKKHSPSIKVPAPNRRVKHSESVNQPSELKAHRVPYIQKKHKPQQYPYHQTVHYFHPVQYHYLVPPMYLYRGIWIRWWVDSPNGFVVQNGYPYYVWNGYLHRYSSTDEGSYDVVDSYTDTIYATFYGQNIRQAYDRAAEMRDILNYREKADRYFCAERFEYDAKHEYDWNPDDYPDWLWE